jgi:hypothetical protein
MNYIPAHNIPIVELIRLQESYLYGTFGVLRINKDIQCFTLEPRDEENEQEISSIPAQQYTCKRVSSPHFGDTFEVTGVPDRTTILFHSGNFADNTKGCILLGTGTGFIEGKKAITGSRTAFIDFMKLLKSFNEFHLTIKELY